jgi:hypothetical protein
VDGDEGGGYLVSLALACIILLASWIGDEGGGYFVSEGALAALILAVLTLVIPINGAFRAAGSRWSALALVLFAAYSG